MEQDAGRHEAGADGVQLSLWPALERGAPTRGDPALSASRARRTEELVEYLVRRWRMPPLRDGDAAPVVPDG